MFRTIVSRSLHYGHRVRLNDEGGSVVEMAIASALSLAALFGIIEVCWGLYAYNFVCEAAREGARYAIVRGATYSGTNCTSPGYATCMAQGGNTGDIAQFVRNLAYPGITASKLNVGVTWPGTVVNPNPCPSAAVSPVCNGPGNLVQVTVAYPYPLNIPFAPKANIWMSSKSQLVISQ